MGHGGTDSRRVRSRDWGTGTLLMQSPSRHGQSRERKPRRHSRSLTPLHALTPSLLSPARHTHSASGGALLATSMTTAVPPRGGRKSLLQGPLRRRWRPWLWCTLAGEETEVFWKSRAQRLTLRLGLGLQRRRWNARQCSPPRQISLLARGPGAVSSRHDWCFFSCVVAPSISPSASGNTGRMLSHAHPWTLRPQWSAGCRHGPWIMALPLCLLLGPSPGEHA
ncbi:hypothetical protein EDB80DRAFT_153654 [Ilyonectria destructans]|nr:hypothetical protein EDB80DRAFT_153654 [Ilyonectria destructans]